MGTRSFDQNERVAKMIAALSSDLGTVRNVALPDDHPPTRFILHIQDVHGNLDAQRRIGEAVEALGKQGAVGLIALEGTHRVVDLKRFRAFPDRPSIKLAADYLLREKKISGPVFTAFTGSVELPPFQGVEDPVLHQDNIKALKDAWLATPALRTVLSGDRVRIVAGKRFFSAQLLSLDQAVQRHRAGTDTLAEYLRAISQGIPEEKIPPSVRTFLKAVFLENSLDFAEVERQRTLFLDRLNRAGERAEVQKSPSREEICIRAIVVWGTRLRLGQISQTDFYRQLRTLGRDVGVSLTNFPALDRYVDYVLATDAVSVEELFEQVDRLEQEAYRRVATSQEWALVTEDRALYLAEKLLNFGLTPQEWKEYQEHPRPDLEKHELFYRIADARNGPLAKNLLAAMDRAGTKTAVLVTGGYHSPGISRCLTEANAAVVRFTPRIEKTTPSDTKDYLSLFTQKKTPLDKLFSGEKLFLSLDPNPSGTEETVAALACGASLSGEARIPQRFFRDLILRTRAELKARRLVSGETEVTVRWAKTLWPAFFLKIRDGQLSVRFQQRSDVVGPSRILTVIKISTIVLFAVVSAVFLSFSNGILGDFHSAILPGWDIALMSVFFMGQTEPNSKSSSPGSMADYFRRLSLPSFLTPEEQTQLNEFLRQQTVRSSPLTVSLLSRTLSLLGINFDAEGFAFSASVAVGDRTHSFSKKAVLIVLFKAFWESLTTDSTVETKPISPSSVSSPSKKNGVSEPPPAEIEPILLDPSPNEEKSQGIDTSFDRMAELRAITDVAQTGVAAISGIQELMTDTYVEQEARTIHAVWMLRPDTQDVTHKINIINGSLDDLQSRGVPLRTPEKDYRFYTLIRVQQTPNGIEAIFFRHKTSEPVPTEKVRKTGFPKTVLLTRLINQLVIKHRTKKSGASEPPRAKIEPPLLNPSLDNGKESLRIDASSDRMAELRAITDVAQTGVVAIRGIEELMRGKHVEQEARTIHAVWMLRADTEDVARKIDIINWSLEDLQSRGIPLRTPEIDYKFYTLIRVKQTRNGIEATVFRNRTSGLVPAEEIRRILYRKTDLLVQLSRQLAIKHRTEFPSDLLSNPDPLDRGSSSARLLNRLRQITGTDGLPGVPPQLKTLSLNPDTEFPALTLQAIYGLGRNPVLVRETIDTINESLDLLKKQGRGFSYIPPGVSGQNPLRNVLEKVVLTNGAFSLVFREKPETNKQGKEILVNGARRWDVLKKLLKEFDRNKRDKSKVSKKKPSQRSPPLSLFFHAGLLVFPKTWLGNPSFMAWFKRVSFVSVVLAEIPVFLLVGAGMDLGFGSAFSWGSAVPALLWVGIPSPFIAGVGVMIFILLFVSLHSLLFQVISFRGTAPLDWLRTNTYRMRDQVQILLPFALFAVLAFPLNGFSLMDGGAFLFTPLQAISLTVAGPAALAGIYFHARHDLHTLGIFERKTPVLPSRREVPAEAVAAGWVAKAMALETREAPPALEETVLRQIFLPAENLGLASLGTRGIGRRRSSSGDRFHEELHRAIAERPTPKASVVMEALSALFTGRPVKPNAVAVQMPIVSEDDVPKIKTLFLKMRQWNRAHTESPLRLFIVAAGPGAYQSLANLIQEDAGDARVIQGGTDGRTVDMVQVNQEFLAWMAGQENISLTISRSLGISLNGMDRLADKDSLLGQALEIFKIRPVEPTDLINLLETVNHVLKNA